MKTIITLNSGKIWELILFFSLKRKEPKVQGCMDFAKDSDPPLNTVEPLRFLTAFLPYTP
jgi:hypothetical protein